MYSLIRISRIQTIFKLLSLAILFTIILIIPSYCKSANTTTTNNTNWDPYEILGVKHDATMEEIDEAHSKMLEKSRIDRSIDISERFNEIQKAYEYLQLHHHHQKQNQHNHQQIVSSKSQDTATTLSSTTDAEKKASLESRLIGRVVTYSIRFMNYCTALEITSSLMLFLVAFCTLLLISRKWKSLRDTTSIGALSEDSNSNNSVNISSDRRRQTKQYLTMKILELKLETYNGMIRLSSPGHRTIVLLCDYDSKDKLLIQFKKAVWPYRKNKTLLFGYLCLDKNLDWYRSILEEVLGIESLSLNKKYCIGTVLSLNGYKRYFRLYHAKHREYNNHIIDEEEEEELQEDMNSYNPGVLSHLGAIENGCQSSSGKSLDDGLLSESNFKGFGRVVPVVDNLLDQLPDWLDKMFDGLTKKYPLDAWPDDMR